MTDLEEAQTRRRRPRPDITDGEYNDGFSKNHREEADEDKEQRRKQHRRKNKRRRSRDLEQPFYVLFLQVGASLFLLCSVSFYLYRTFVPPSPITDIDAEGVDDFTDDDDNLNLEELEAAAVEAVVPTPAPTKPTAPPLPVWELGKATAFDAFGIAELYHSSNEVKNNGSINKDFWDTAASLRTEFADLYGGENAVRAMMERGMTFFPANTTDAKENQRQQRPPSDLVATACRIQQAKTEGRSFKFTFGGYSVTVGRGNYFHQSFPFVMERILQEPFQSLGIDLSVKNAAIGGCPSFPYGFCKKNHWGEDSDVVSWDFSMNEAGGIAEGLEAYLRHTMTLSRRPKLIMKDTFAAEKRRALLKSYVDLGAISDPMVLHSDPGVRPFLELREDFRPIGFQEWRTFGSPPGAPGQALHHPAVKEHELVAWMLAMHFLSALELVAAAAAAAAAAENTAAYSVLQISCPSATEVESQRSNTNLLPPPVTINVTTAKEWSSVFFGVPYNGDLKSSGGSASTQNSQQWKMNPVHCKTLYEPQYGPREGKDSGSLTSIVVSGSTGEDMDIMLPKSHMFYNEAWVLDLSEGEKEAKRKLDRFGGLGFHDSKKAYRGLFNSGALRFFLPYYDSDEGGQAEDGSPEVGDAARNWFQSVVVCEVNERREPSACQTGSDITFKTGGIKATEVILLDAPGTLYLGKKICSYINIPEEARITSREAMMLEDPTLPGGDRLEATTSTQENKVSPGLSLELTVHNHHIVARDDACSVSHVVWEQRSPAGARLPLQAPTEPPTEQKGTPASKKRINVA